MMENHFKSFVEIRNFENRFTKKVFLAESICKVEGYPPQFIVKQYTTSLPPEEFLMHKLISESCDSVVKLYYWFQNQKEFYMCIEYCPNGSLYEVLRTQTKFCFDYCLRYCYQLSLTVLNMHQQKRCHQDIKPANIFITENYFYFKLGGFSESKVINENEEFYLVVGTPAYMAPEQREALKMKRKRLNNPFRNDIWALGLTFLEIFMGRLCEELYGKDLSVIHSFIDNNVTGGVFQNELAALLKMMICEKRLFNLDCFEVANKIYKIYLDNQKNEESLQRAEVICRENEIDQSRNLRNISSCPDITIPINYSVIPENHESSPNDYIDESSPNDGISNENKDSDFSERSLQNKEFIFETICALCVEIVEGNGVVLPCKHLLHQGCFKAKIQDVMIQSKIKLENFVCGICKRVIPFSFLENQTFMPPKARLKATLQEFSRTHVYCSNCPNGVKYYLLNQSLSPGIVKCTSCHSAFCSFCSVKDGHYLSCRLFSKFKSTEESKKTSYMSSSRAFK